MAHTVEKIGGTSMSKLDVLRDTLFTAERKDESLYGRVFVVSAFAGITNLLLEHKKTGEAGVYALFANADSDHSWHEALDRVAVAMTKAHDAVLDHDADRERAGAFVQDRIEGARNCLIDLQRLCSYGHFRLAEHMLQIRELLSGLGEAHSALVTTLMLQRHGINARLVDLSGWRDDGEVTLEQRIGNAMDGIDPAVEMPIVTGYAQCAEGLMREFDRGYSEVTFSCLAALTHAREAIIHKEFHLSSADPKLVGAEAVRKLGRTNYDVADQLSNMGMEAIHPKAAKTLRQAEVPLRVTNAFDPGDPGTLIDDQPADHPGVEIITGLDIIALELFEQDMVGVKGYDAAILDVLTRHDVRIVSKVSNANTITHYLDTSLKAMRRVEKDLAALYPQALITSRKLALASVIGRDLSGLSVLTRGLQAIADHGLESIGASQGPRNVDTQFILERDDLKPVIKALHDAFITDAAQALCKAA
ncbi:Aspartokinase I/homoserine dehydrogenase I [Thalassovita gelatinovora]|uniref:aspartate kinase n=1 Tax=Thalassovita gelatinovora TaxID=53501 RepID=A0A0P1FFR4_THAGE|nr:aspartate kinase [Thalassovita gelatinovora]QIZ79820.1 aspartate kinase [Thalassovita gelatinovora]CUH66880.1 Aspartokinase I/homoserine dehydrogenase I [Thalassovita gelatinovora]SEQ44452.1 aspartate kinase [Thalassovita gelatinovora]